MDGLLSPCMYSGEDAQPQFDSPSFSGPVIGPQERLGVGFLQPMTERGRARPQSDRPIVSALV